MSLVGESRTREGRATQGCDPRRIRVTEAPRPKLVSFSC